MIRRRHFLRLAAAAAATPLAARVSAFLPPSPSPGGPRKASVGLPGETDLVTVRDRMLRMLAARAFADPQAAIASAQKVAASLDASGQWPGIDYVDVARGVWKASSHPMNILRMAIAYRAGADAGRADAALLQKIATALQWWLDHDPRNPNWWWNEIGVPRVLGDAGMFLHDALSPEQAAGIVRILQRSVWTKWTGQNLVWGCENQVARGIVAAEPQTVMQAFTRMYEEVKIGPPTGEGIMPDMSFHQHGPQLYSGGYGLGFATDVGAFISFAAGTPFQPPPETLDLYSRYVLDGEAWMTRGNIFDYSCVGREITRKGKAAVPADRTLTPETAGATFYLDDVVRSLASRAVPRRAEFQAFAARLDSSDGAQPLSGNRHFWCSDYMAHQRPAFFASVRMFSTRTLNTELVNDEGKRSHHLADGCTFLYRFGDEYRDIFPVWDWSKVPGTTAEQMELAGTPRYKTDATFVGGASDGTYGVAAQQLHRESLRARKAWFLFDHGFAALGAGINCDSDRPVVTAVNQCLARHNVIPLNSNQRIWHDGVTYIFPGKQNVQFTRGAQTGRWSDLGTGSNEAVSEEVFKAWIEHGSRPAGASYAYFVLPSGNDWHSGLSEDPAWDVLCNTPALQAVRDRKLNIVGAVFWEAGSLRYPPPPSGDGVTPEEEAMIASVDQPCLLMIRTAGKRLRVSVSNPANQPLRVNVTLPRTLKRAGAPRSANETIVTFDLPDGAMAGLTVTRELLAV